MYSVSAGPAAHVFLSYAHGERADDERVHRFFDALCTEIRVLTGADRGAVVGFHDNGILRAGDDWPRELAAALATAHTLVALWSPRYFRSEFCRTEWAVFDARIRSGTPIGVRPSRAIPVVWVRTAVPAALSHVQYRDASFGAAYDRLGLRRLMREDERRYTRFVAALAERIVEVAAGPPLPALNGWDDLARRPAPSRPAGSWTPASCRSLRHSVRATGRARAVRSCPRCRTRCRGSAPSSVSTRSRTSMPVRSVSGRDHRG
jgi:hypothetical protein